MAILDQRLLILGRSKICLILFSGRNYVPFYYWSKICPLYLLVEKVSVDNMSVENMSVKKTSRCPQRRVMLCTQLEIGTINCWYLHWKYHVPYLWFTSRFRYKRTVNVYEMQIDWFNRQLVILGQWLWLSWQSGCFQFQRSVVQIQSSANIYQNIYSPSTVLKRRK